MSYYQPKIVGSFDELSTNFQDISSREILTGPYQFSKTTSSHDLKDIFGPILLYDIPDDIYIFLRDIPIPCTIFDYFNPLIITDDLLKNTIFFRQESNDALEEFNCSCIVSKIFKSFVEKLSSTPTIVVHYPKNYFIDYNNMTVSRSGKIIQFCELIEFELKLDSIIELSEIPLNDPLYFAMNYLREILSDNSADTSSETGE